MCAGGKSAKGGDRWIRKNKQSPSNRQDKEEMQMPLKTETNGLPSPLVHCKG